VVFDPGLGFGKTAAQSIELLAGLDGLLSLGRPVYVGPSRKRFLGELTGKPVTDRDEATGVACALAWERGARIFRVHDPARARDALEIASSLQGS
jgi:dihydropteroate synthase